MNMGIDGVVAAIVTYNPDANRLEQNLAAVSPQVFRVYVMDNASENIGAIKEVVGLFENAVVVNNHANIGISRALNKAAIYCEELGCGYLLTLDQDSVCPKGMVERLLARFDGPRVGLACPSYYDSRRKLYNPRHSFDEEATYVDMAITSGSLCAMDAYREVGGFDPTLFVGGTDTDYSMALLRHGWNIVQDNACLLDHELGVVEDAPHAGTFLKLHEKTGVELFRKLSYRREVSAFRAYHGVRAQVYLFRKYGTDVSTRREIAKNMVSNIMRGQKHFAILRASIRGLAEGMRLPIYGGSSKEEV